MRTSDNEPFTMQRDAKAVIVPAGVEVNLKAGQSGYITQALGGNFTLYIEGNLFRLAGEDADAIGKEVVKPPELPPNATEEDVRKLAWEQMKSCYDPEIPINIVELGLVERLDITPARVALTLVLTSPTCPMGDAIADDAWQALHNAFPQREVSVEEAQGVDWGPQRMSEAARQRLGWNDAPG